MRSHEYHHKDIRAEIFKRCDYKCVNCGSEDYLIMHHIVPLGRGGKDVPSNIVLLCNECHRKVHGISLYELSKENNPYPGRPLREKPKDFDKWAEKFIKGEIGKKEFLKKVKMCKQDLSPSSRIPFYRDYLKEHGIAEFKSNVDYIESYRKRGIESKMVRVQITYEV